MISKEAQKMGWPDLTSPKIMEQSKKELINQYQEYYLIIQKALSNKLLEEKDELEIAKIRQQRQEMGEVYEKTMAEINKKI